MLFARTFAVLAVASSVAIPALAQNTTTAAGDVSAASMAPSTNYASLRDNLADRSETLTTDVNKQRAILKKNQELLKEAQRLDAMNKKMLAEKQRMLQQNAEMERQRASLASAQAAAESQAQPEAKAAPADVTMAKASTGDIK